MNRRLSAEDTLQLFTVQLLEYEALPGVVWFHVPNAGKRSPRTGAHLKRLGMQPGAPDIVAILPGGSCRLLELKRPKTALHRAGVLSEDQRKFKASCDAANIPYAVASTPEEVTTLLLGWNVLRDPATIKAAFAS